MKCTRLKSKLLGSLTSALHTLTGARQSEIAARASTERIRSMYERFRETLTLNDSTLQLVADVEDRLSGRKAFSMNAISQRIRQAELDVFTMVRNLDRMNPGHCQQLYDSLSRIRSGIDSELSAAHEIPSGPLVIPLSKLDATCVASVGRKMANLGEIRNVLKLNVPDGFAVTTYAFTRFMLQEDLMSKGGIWQRAEKLDDVLESYGSRAVEEACREVQQAMIGASMPPDLEQAILGAYDELEGEKQGLVAVRSSAISEDLEASHAGQFQTELNISRKWLLDSYRWVLASTYGVSPVTYRLRHGLTSQGAYMCVGCQKMVAPRCSGIIFSRSFANSEDDKVVISAVRGLSDAGTGQAAEHEEITIGSTQATAARSSILTEPELIQLAEVARKLEHHFGCAQDIEWAIAENGDLYILQCRPMHTAINASNHRPQRISGAAEPVLHGGLSACPGIGMGPVFQIRQDDELAHFPDGAVLVSMHSSPRYSQVMSRCAAIITERGSPIGHMAILSREFGVPTIIGLTGAMKQLENGRMITVDAASLNVFDGAVALTDSQTPDSERPPDTPGTRKLRRVAKWVTPLNLADTAAPEFAPANCTSLHDVTRYVHEKLFEAMFYLGDGAALSPKDSYVLEGRIPYIVYVLDVGGGLVQKERPSQKVGYADILSVPMRSFLQGLSDQRIKLDKPRAISARGFLSVLGQSVAGLPADARGLGRASFAIIADRYMNFSTKAGYHFNTVDTYCGKNLNKNYIHFRFEGGAADEIRRERRCLFLLDVLQNLDFKVQCRGDVLAARLEKYDAEFINSRLEQLGRVTLCCRQLDMLMNTDASPKYFAQAFLNGELERFF